MKCVIEKLNYWFLAVSVLFYHSTVWAELPKPPDSDMASGNKSWIDVGDTMMKKVAHTASIIVGAIILIGVAATILKAYHVANEKGDLGHFFKMLIIGLIAAAIGMGLVYAGYQIVK